MVKDDAWSPLGLQDEKETQAVLWKLISFKGYQNLCAHEKHVHKKRS